ncbi:MAG: DUF4270 family protein [Marinilabiliaceae bacterium]|nr:DUF4270 family protein [Marinilabiliaceae bacterium]
MLGIFFTIAIFSPSCSDDASEVGLGVLPESDFFKPYYYDETKLICFNTDTLLNTNDSHYGILGDFYDPVFGHTKAEMIFQVGATVQTDTTDFIFYSKRTLNDTITVADLETDDSIIIKRIDTTIIETAFIDSLTLSFIFDNTASYGYDSTKLNIKIFELTDLLADTSRLYSNIDMTNLYNPVPIGEKQVMAKYITDNDSSLVYMYDADGITHKKTSDDKDSTYYKKYPQWTIKLSKELAQRIYNLDKSVINNKAAFQNVLKGFYIQAEKNTAQTDVGCLLKTNFLHTPTQNEIINIRPRLTLYYEYNKTINEFRDSTFKKSSKNSKGTIIKKTRTIQSFSFTPGYQYTRFNRFTQESNLGALKNDTSAANLYIQGISNQYAKISIDTTELAAWRDSLELYDKLNPTQIGFTSIDLIFEVDSTLSDLKNYPAPNALYIKNKNENGDLLSPQFTYKNYPYNIFYDGTPNTEESKYGKANYSNGRYHFKIRKEFLEGFLKQEIDTKEIPDFKNLYLISGSPKTDVRRVVLKSPKSETGQLKLNIKYIKYQK